MEVEKVEDNDIAVILFTSGTTGILKFKISYFYLFFLILRLFYIITFFYQIGKSKGAATSHGVLCRNARLLVSTWKFSSEDILLHALPFYHVHGMLIAFHCTLFSKSSTIFLNKYIASDVAKWMPEATVFMGVPTFYRFLNLKKIIFLYL